MKLWPLGVIGWLMLCRTLVAQDAPIPEADTPVEDSQDSWELGNGIVDLSYTQDELRQRLSHGFSLDWGPSMPWFKYGLGLLWNADPYIDSLTAAVGKFQFSGNLNQRNYIITTQSQAFFLTRRKFPLSFAPLYIEPMVGLVRWNGDIQPRGDDPVKDEIASSLSSRFDAIGISLGGNMGIMWIFNSGWFLQYNLLSVNWSYILKESYTTQTSATNKRIHQQLEGPLSMNTAHVRLGWSKSI